MTDVMIEPMDIECPTCHGEGFKIVDTVAGLLRCDFCHNQWIDSRFAEGPKVERTMREHTRKGLFSKERTIETREVTGTFSSNGRGRSFSSSTETSTTTTTTNSKFPFAARWIHEPDHPTHHLGIDERRSTVFWTPLRTVLLVMVVLFLIAVLR